MKTTIDISKRTNDLLYVESLGKISIVTDKLQLATLCYDSCTDDNVLDYSESQKANAAFIVLACNNFDRMKAELERVYEKYGLLSTKQLLESIEKDIS